MGEHVLIVSGVESSSKDSSEAEARSSEHYDKEYYAYQQPIGEFGAWANLPKFKRFVEPGMNVLDFGCGGGFLLEQLECRGRVGIEPNAEAREAAESRGLTVFATTASLDDNWADLIISNNALEHCRLPLRELELLLPKLKVGGLAVFIVPCESISYRYSAGDPNHHLYSWSPMSIGNLFTEAGYEVLESVPYIHKWPPGHRAIARLFGRRAFDLASRLYARIERSWFQIRVVSRRPGSHQESSE
jgi:SAM-dependent methyltransferase